MKNLTSVILKNSKRRDIKSKSVVKDSALAVLSFIIVFVFLAIVMIVASIYVTKELADIDQTYAFVNILLLMNFFLLFAKSIFESLNVLYFSKDLKVLLRMPIKSKNILNSKLFNMIISEYEMELIMLAIPMIVYGIFTNVGAMFYFYMVVILLILPVIPISITSFIISIIMRFTNKIKNKSKAMYVTIIVAILAVGLVTTGLELNSNFSVEEFEDIILTENALAEKIADSFILIKPIMSILLNYDNIYGIVNLIIYIAESFILYKILVFIMSKIYLKGAIGATINSGKGKNYLQKELSLSDFKKRNKNKSYFLKELKILCRTPIFFIECIIMPLIYPVFVFLVMAIFISFANSVGVDALADFYNRLTMVYGQAIFISIGQVFYMMNFCSIIAVSRESKNAIITKYIPIKLSKQFNLKISIGIIINMMSSILVSVAYYVCIKNLVYAIMMFIILVFVNLICEKFKLLIDLKSPKISWDNEYTMMKQNTNVMYELFYTLIVIGILFLICAFIKNIAIYLIVVLALSIIINFLINEYIYQKQEKIFEKVF